MSIKFHLTTKLSLLLFVVLKLWWLEKLNIHLPWAKTKKESFLEWPFPLIKRKESFGKKLIFFNYYLLDFRNILRTRMNEMIGHLLSEVFSSHSWKITVFPQLALLPLVVQYPLSGIKAQLHPSAPPTPPPPPPPHEKKTYFFHLCVKDLLTLPWNSFLTTCLKIFNLQNVVLTLINPWKSFPF